MIKEDKYLQDERGVARIWLENALEKN